MPDPVAEPRDYRDVVGHFATGVAVVTGHGPRGPVGLTTNAVTSLSLEPRLLLVCFDLTSRTLQTVRETGRFAVNVLRIGQEDVAHRFASKAPPEEKFAGVEFTLEHEVPLLDDALAWVTCEVLELRPGGDHEIGIGTVTSARHADGDPLVFFRGGYRALSDSF